jgi:hypothetical protein
MSGAARLKNMTNVIEEKRMGTGLESRRTGRVVSLRNRVIADRWPDTKVSAMPSINCFSHQISVVIACREFASLLIERQPS